VPQQSESWGGEQGEERGLLRCDEDRGFEPECFIWMDTFLPVDTSVRQIKHYIAPVFPPNQANDTVHQKVYISDYFLCPPLWLK
jgi:hypothetical protein